MLTPAPDLPGSLRSPEAPPGRILVVDDKPAYRALLRDLLQGLGWRVSEAGDTREAVAQILQTPPDVVLCDIVLPGQNGVDFCRELKHAPPTRLLPVVLLTGQDTPRTRHAAREAGADDFFTKPFSPAEIGARLRALLEHTRFLETLEKPEILMTTLALTIEARDPYTGGHCARLGRTVVALGRRLGLGSGALDTLRLAGMLHDLGKITVPDRILLKPGPLTDEERAVMQQHPARGAELCQPLQALRAVQPLILCHHERWDGSGYPHGLAGPELPLEAQILGLADVWDALVTRRPYKIALPHDEARQILETETRQGLWAPGLVLELSQLVEQELVP